MEGFYISISDLLAQCANRILWSCARCSAEDQTHILNSVKSRRTANAGHQGIKKKEGLRPKLGYRILKVPDISVFHVHHHHTRTIPVQTV